LSPILSGKSATAIGAAVAADYEKRNWTKNSPFVVVAFVAILPQDSPKMAIFRH